MAERLLLRFALLCGCVLCANYVTVSHPLPDFYVEQEELKSFYEPCFSPAALKEDVTVSVLVRNERCRDLLLRVFNLSEVRQDGSLFYNFPVTTRELGKCLEMRLLAVSIVSMSETFVWIFQCTKEAKKNYFYEPLTWEWYLWAIFGLIFILSITVISVNCFVDWRTRKRIIRIIKTPAYVSPKDGAQQLDGIKSSPSAVTSGGLLPVRGRMRSPSVQSGPPRHKSPPSHIYPPPLPVTPAVPRRTAPLPPAGMRFRYPHPMTPTITHIRPTVQSHPQAPPSRIALIRPQASSSLQGPGSVPAQSISSTAPVQPSQATDQNPSKGARSKNISDPEASPFVSMSPATSAEVKPKLEGKAEKKKGKTTEESSASPLSKEGRRRAEEKSTSESSTTNTREGADTSDTRGTDKSP